MTWHPSPGRLDHAARTGAVDRVEHDDVRALGDGGVDLLGLLGLVLVGVVVDDVQSLQSSATCVLEQRLVEGLVAGGLGLRQQQGDGLAVAAAVGGVAAASVVVGAAGGQGRGAEEQGSAAGGDAVDGASMGSPRGCQGCRATNRV